jgi:hypothetical protein
MKYLNSPQEILTKQGLSFVLGAGKSYFGKGGIKMRLNIEELCLPEIKARADGQGVQASLYVFGNQIVLNKGKCELLFNLQHCYDKNKLDWDYVKIVRYTNELISIVAKFGED